MLLIYGLSSILSPLPLLCRRRKTHRRNRIEASSQLSCPRHPLNSYFSTLSVHHKMLSIIFNLCSYYTKKMVVERYNVSERRLIWWYGEMVVEVWLRIVKKLVSQFFRSVLQNYVLDLEIFQISVAKLCFRSRNYFVMLFGWIQSYTLTLWVHVSYWGSEEKDAENCVLGLKEEDDEQ